MVWNLLEECCLIQVRIDGSRSVSLKTKKFVLKKIYKKEYLSIFIHDRISLVKMNLLQSKQMKNYRNSQPYQAKSDDKNRKMGSVQSRSSNQLSRNTHNRLTEYQHITRRAKQQLKDLQTRRKNSPEPNKFQFAIEQYNSFNANQKATPLLSKTPSSPNQYKNSSSQKFFKRQNNNYMRTQTEERHDHKDYLQRSTHRQVPRHYEKYSADVKVGSPRKKQYIDSSEYKKLHQKLDSIETKITDMKRNLQKKKEEKQKLATQQQRVEDNQLALDLRPVHQNKQAEEKKLGLKAFVTKVPEQTNLHTFTINPYSPRHNVYYVSELVRAYKDERSLARQHLTTSLGVMRILQRSRRMGQQQLKKRKVRLPRKKQHIDKKTIIFDLDQTLIHCNDNLNEPADVVLTIKFPTGESIQAGINIRPYARQILKTMNKYFEVVVFTASHSCYANVVIDHLDPNRELIHHRLFRQHCYLSAQGLYVKDLRIIDRDPKQMVLVDNAAYSYFYQLANGIPILPYFHGQIDFQLKALEDYLVKLAFCKDVREVNLRTFKLDLYKNYYNRPQQLVEELYINE